MGLSELKSQIERDSRRKIEAKKKEALAEQSAVLHKAKKQSEAILSEAKSEAKKLSDSILSEAMVEAESDENTILASAMDSKVAEELQRLNDVIIKDLCSKEKQLILSAIKSFAEFSSLSNSTFEASKKNQELGKGFSKKIVNNNINGALLYSNDKKIFLDATPENVLASNYEKLRSMLFAHISKS